jgi:hypothetical protein
MKQYSWFVFLGRYRQVQTILSYRHVQDSYRNKQSFDNTIKHMDVLNLVINQRVSLSLSMMMMMMMMMTF